MALTIGLVLAIAVGVFARSSRLDRDRAFYPTVTIVVAAYYVLFAAMGASIREVILESLAGSVFVILAVYGFRSSLWVVAAALAAHGIFDFAHHLILTNPGVPVWWPRFCFAYDVAAAGYLSWLLQSGRVRAAG